MNNSRPRQDRLDTDMKLEPLIARALTDPELLAGIFSNPDKAMAADHIPVDRESEKFKELHLRVYYARTILLRLLSEWLKEYDTRL